MITQQTSIDIAAEGRSLLDAPRRNSWAMQQYLARVLNRGRIHQRFTEPDTKLDKQTFRNYILVAVSVLDEVLEFAPPGFSAGCTVNYDEETSVVENFYRLRSEGPDFQTEGELIRQIRKVIEACERMQRFGREKAQALYDVSIEGRRAQARFSGQSESAADMQVMRELERARILARAERF